MEERRFGIYLFVVLLATSFHLTALVTLLLYPFMRFRLNAVNFIILLVGCGVFARFAGSVVLNYIISRFYSLYSMQMDAGGGFSMFVLLFAVTIIGILLKSKREMPQEAIFSHMMVLACCMQLFAMQFALFARIVMYFSFAMIVWIPSMVVKIEGREGRSFATGIVCALAVAYFVLIIVGRNAAGIAPCRFMWE